MKLKWLIHARLFAIPWTAAHQAPPSMGFSRQEYWSGVPLTSPSLASTNLGSIWLLFTFFFCSPFFVGLEMNMCLWLCVRLLLVTETVFIFSLFCVSFRIFILLLLQNLYSFLLLCPICRPFYLIKVLFKSSILIIFFFLMLFMFSFRSSNTFNTYTHTCMSVCIKLF